MTLILCVCRQWRTSTAACTDIDTDVDTGTDTDMDTDMDTGAVWLQAVEKKYHSMHWH